MINSRRKGAKGERRVAELFKKWTGKAFAKTPSSGGLNWKTTNVRGDIVCTVEGHYFPFCIEVKTHKEIDFSHLISPNIKQPKIIEFWEQSARDAEKAKKIPMLLMRYDRMPADLYFLAVEKHFFHYLCSKASVEVGLVIRHTLNFWDKDKGIVLEIIPSTEFLKLDYKKTKKIAKTYLKERYGCQK